MPPLQNICSFSFARLKVQKVDFENECLFLLQTVTGCRGNAMINDLRHELWHDDGLEQRLKLRLDSCYDACISALTLVNEHLLDILKETRTLDILLRKVVWPSKS